jgi:hypothetical protein
VNTKGENGKSKILRNKSTFNRAIKKEQQTLLFQEAKTREGVYEKE